MIAAAPRGAANQSRWAAASVQRTPVRSQVSGIPRVGMIAPAPSAQPQAQAWVEPEVRTICDLILVAMFGALFAVYLLDGFSWDSWVGGALLTLKTAVASSTSSNMAT